MGGKFSSAGLGGLEARPADLGALLHGHEDDRLDDRQPDRRHHAERGRADELVAVLEVALERVDREQREVGFLGGPLHEVHVDELLHLHVFDGHVLDDARKEAGDRRADHLHAKYPFHSIQLLLRELRVE